MISNMYKIRKGVSEAITKNFAKVNREGVGFLTTNINSAINSAMDIMDKAPTSVAVIISPSGNIKAMGYVAEDGYFVTTTGARVSPWKFVADDEVIGNDASHNRNRDRNYGLRPGDIVVERHDGIEDRGGVVVTWFGGDNNRVKVMQEDGTTYEGVAEWQRVVIAVEDRIS